jgi:hypothetical protein
LKTCFAFLLTLTAQICYAQPDSVVNAIQAQLRNDSLTLYSPKRVSFDFQLDNRNSFIRNQAIEIEGLNPGILVRRKFRYGLGLYRVRAPYESYKSTKRSSVSGEGIATNRELDMYFATPNFRYIFVTAKWIQVASELALGFGAVKYTIKSEDNTKVLARKDGLFVPSGLGLEVVLIPFRWVGAGGSVGYRKSLGTYDINADFDGLYYSYGVKIFIGTIYKDLRYKAIKRRAAEATRNATAAPE